MSLEAMRVAAINEIRLLTEADCTPVITNEIPDLVARHQVASIWIAANAYAYGDKVQLEPRNGRRYRCIVAGTSAATSAAFPTSLQTESGARGRVSDGTVIWADDGADDDTVFNIRAAVHEGWMLKAGKASGLVSRSFGNSRIEASSLQAQCRQRAIEYAPWG